MDLREAMKARHMVRKYLDKSMPEDIVQKLNTRVKENNEKYGVAVELRINDTSAFNSLIKLILAKGVQNFFVLQGNDTPELDENLGKCGADIMLVRFVERRKGLGFGDGNRKKHLLQWKNNP